MSNTSTAASAGSDTAKIQATGWGPYEDYCNLFHSEGTPEYCECRAEDPDDGCGCGSWDSTVCSCVCDDCDAGCGTAAVDPADPFGPCVITCDSCTCENQAPKVGGGEEPCACDCTGICQNGGTPDSVCACDCSTATIPEHAHLVGNVCDWVCDSGYVREGDACVGCTPDTPCGCGGRYNADCQCIEETWHVGDPCGCGASGVVTADCMCSKPMGGDDCGCGGHVDPLSCECIGQDPVPGSICGIGKVWKDCDTCACIDGFEECGDSCYQPGTADYCINCLDGCWSQSDATCHVGDAYDCVNCKSGCWYKSACRVPGEATCGCHNEGTLQADCSCDVPEVGDTCGCDGTGTVQDDCTCSAPEPGDECGECGHRQSDCSCYDPCASSDSSSSLDSSASSPSSPSSDSSSLSSSSLSSTSSHASSSSSSSSAYCNEQWCRDIGGTWAAGPEGHTVCIISEDGFDACADGGGEPAPTEDGGWYCACDGGDSSQPESSPTASGSSQSSESSVSSVSSSASSRSSSSSSSSSDDCGTAGWCTDKVGGTWLPDSGVCQITGEASESTCTENGGAVHQYGEEGSYVYTCECDSPQPPSSHGDSSDDSDSTPSASSSSSSSSSSSPFSSSSPSSSMSPDSGSHSSSSSSSSSCDKTECETECWCKESVYGVWGSVTIEGETFSACQVGSGNTYCAESGGKIVTVKEYGQDFHYCVCGSTPSSHEDPSSRDPSSPAPSSSSSVDPCTEMGIGGIYDAESGCCYDDPATGSYVDEDTCNELGYYYSESGGSGSCCEVYPSSDSSDPSSDCPDKDAKELTCASFFGAFGFTFEDCTCIGNCTDPDAVADKCANLGGTYFSSGDECGCYDYCTNGTSRDTCDGTYRGYPDCACDEDSDPSSEDPCEGVSCGCGTPVPDGKGGCSCDCSGCEQPECHDKDNACRLDCTLCTHPDGSCGPCGTWEVDKQGTGCACTCEGACGDDGDKNCVYASSGGVCECKENDPCKNNKCQNGSTCVPSADGKSYTCDCGACAHSPAKCGSWPAGENYFWQGKYCHQKSDCAGFARGDTPPAGDDPYQGGWADKGPCVRV